MRPTKLFWTLLGGALASLCLSLSAVGHDKSWQELFAQGEQAEQAGETRRALELFLSAEKTAPPESEFYIKIAKQYSDLIFESKDSAEQKRFAEACLTYSRRAVAANTNNARAHLSVAVGLAKNFPYLDNQTRVDYSREIKARTEKAIELNPQEDVAYHMLGRWHFEVANMNPFVKGLAKLLYGSLPKGTYELAAANFQKAAELAPGRIIHRHELARVWLKQRKRDEAIKELRLCLTLTPMDRDDREAQQSARRQLVAEGEWQETERQKISQPE